MEIIPLTAITFALILLVIILVVTIIGSIYANKEDYKYYREHYRILPIIRFYKWHTSSDWSEEDYVIESTNREVLFLFNSKTIFFNRCNGVILNTIATYFDPYTLYWYIKYRRWFKKNIHINELELKPF